MKDIMLQMIICKECFDYIDLINYDTGEVLLQGYISRDKVNKQIKEFVEELEDAGVNVVYMGSMWGINICNCDRSL